MGRGAASGRIQLCAAQAIPPPAAPSAPPERSQWHAEPLTVFDNLYFVGQTEYSAWAVTTSQGIIVIDTIWDYSVEDEIVDGLKKLGFDPRDIKYAIVSHGHIDRASGAQYLQDHFGTHVIVSPADWDLLSRDTGSWPKPKKDLVATDGEK
jgi:metallo-beta-lactamase class B